MTDLHRWFLAAWISFAIPAIVVGVGANEVVTPVEEDEETATGSEPESPEAARVRRMLEAIVVSGAASGLVAPVPIIEPTVPGGIQSEESRDRKRGSFVVAPIPVSTSTIGSGLAVVSLYTFRPFRRDDASPPTTVGIGGLYTDNDSWAAGIGAKTYLHEDRWRISAGVGTFDVNYPFYGTGNDAGDRGRSIRLDQDGDAVTSQVLRKIAGRWYGGLGYTRLVTTLAIDLSGLLPPDLELPPELADALRLRTTVASLGVRVQYDSRDDVFAPRSGIFFDVLGRIARESVGSDWDYEHHVVAWNAYRNVRERDVVAVRVAACSAIDAPFFDLCLFGSGADLRGYTGGRYRDEAMVATQAEYRWWFHRRWGATAFVGVGEVAPSFGDLDTDRLLPAGGIGLRWQVSKRERLGLRVDYAWGKDSSAFYVSVGEAF